MKIKVPQILQQIAAIFIIGTLAIVGVQNDQIHNRGFDVFDEGAHFDYVVKLSSGHIPAWGTTYEQSTMLIADCLGNSLEITEKNCSVSDRLATNFPPQGYNYEAQQPPLGYVAYLPGLILSTNMDPGPQLNFVRDTGGALLILIILSLIFMISRKLSLGFIRTAVLGVISILSPISIHALSTVNNDASTIIGGLLFVYALLISTRMRGPNSLLLGIGIGLIIALTKGFMLLLPISALIVLSVTAILLSRRKQTPLVAELLLPSNIFTLSAATTALLVSGAFSLWQSSRSIVQAGVVLHALLGFQPTVETIQINTILSSWSNLANSWLGASNGLITMPSFFAVANVLLLVFAGIAANRATNPPTDIDFQLISNKTMILVWVTVILIFGIAWPTLLFIQGGFNFDAPTRYALQILPILATAIVMRLEGKKMIGRTK